MENSTNEDKEKIKQNQVNQKSETDSNEDLLQIVDKLRKENEELKKKLQDQQQKLESAQQECQQLNAVNSKLVKEKTQLCVDVDIWKRKFLALDQKLKTNLAQLEEKEAQVDFLKKELEAKNESNYKMALKLLDYKAKISSTELQLRKFPVKRIYKLYPKVDVELALTKNPSNGTLGINILEKGKRTSRPFKSIQLAKDIENRFYVYYADGGYDTFESNMSQDIVNSFQEVVSPNSSTNNNKSSTSESSET